MDSGVLLLIPFFDTWSVLSQRKLRILDTMLVSRGTSHTELKLSFPGCHVFW